MQGSLVSACLKKVPDYFELIVLAAFRAQEISSGSTPLIMAGQNRSLSVAMREIAQGLITPEALRERVVKGFQQYAFLPENED